MKLEERQVIYKRLEDQNGRHNQLIKAIEEMAELIKELTKMLGKDTYTNNKNICEEIADARTTLEQLERFFDPENRMIEIIQDYKLTRLDMFYLGVEKLTADDVNVTKVAL
jgi:hypothetical protein